MIIYNEKFNLLEDRVYEYALQDVKEPHLYRELFDYESVPKIAFQKRSGSGARLSGIGVEVSRNHDLDPRERKGLRFGQEHERRRDGDPRQLFGLPYFQKNEFNARAGAR